MGVYQTSVLSMSGLVAHWPMSDTSGSAIDDVGPNNMNGAYSGSVTKNQTSMLPGDTSTPCVLFTGGSGTVLDDARLRVNTHTALGWVIPGKLKLAAYLFNRYAQWGYSLSRSHLSSDLGGVTPQLTESLGESVATSGEYFFAGGYDGSRTRLWLNGALVLDVASSGTLNAGSVALSLCSSAGVNVFEGYAQHFSLFNRMLSDQEVKDLYMIGLSGQANPAGAGSQSVMPWSRQIAGSNGLRKRITNSSDTRVFLGLGQPAVLGGPIVEAYGDVRDLSTFTGAVHARHALFLGAKPVTVEEY